MAEDLPLMPKLSNFDLIIDESWYDPHDEQAVLAHSNDIFEVDVFSLSIERLGHDEPPGDNFVLVTNDASEDERGEFQCIEFVNGSYANSTEKEHSLGLQLANQAWPTQKTHSFTEASFTNEQPMFSNPEDQIMRLVHGYLFWLRHSASLGHDGCVSPQLTNAGIVSSGHFCAYEFYGAAFNATQSSISTIPAHHKQARTEWATAKLFSQSAMRQPTARLLVSLLSFYSNAYVPKARNMHRHNFRMLCLEARKLLSADSNLALLLKFLADSDMSNPGTESNVMALLVQILTQHHTFDFDSNYEARELLVNAEKNLGHFETAHYLCDELIAYAVRRAPPFDPAPVRRAWRRKGRIFFAHGDMDSAWEKFMGIHAAWVADNSPSRASREYVVFEDLAKVCRCRGQFDEAKRWFLLAESFSNLAYASVEEEDSGRERRPSLNSLRLRELMELMEKAHIDDTRDEEDRVNRKNSDTWTTVGGDDYRENKEEEDGNHWADYRARELARW